MLYELRSQLVAFFSLHCEGFESVDGGSILAWAWLLAYATIHVPFRDFFSSLVLSNVCLLLVRMVALEDGFAFDVSSVLAIAS